MDDANRDAPDQPPDWVRASIVNTLDELRLFARTLWGITVRPTAFVRAWCAGSERALNPLAFAATCASLLALAMQALALLGFSDDGQPSFLEEVAHQIGPFLQYGVAGFLASLPLLAAKPRRRVRDAVAIGLYAGGPALCAYGVWLIVLGLMWFAAGRPPVTNGLSTMPGAWVGKVSIWIAYVIVALFVRSLWLGLAGLHGGRRGIAGGAAAFAMLVLALVLGAAHQSGPYGLQLVLEHGHHGWWMGVHD